MPENGNTAARQITLSLPSGAVRDGGWETDDEGTYRIVYGPVAVGRLAQTGGRPVPVEVHPFANQLPDGTIDPTQGVGHAAGVTVERWQDGFLRGDLDLTVGGAREYAAMLTAAADQIDRWTGGSRPAPTVEHHELPPIPTPGLVEFFDRHQYAVVTLGVITAEVLRFTYWDPKDRHRGVEHVEVTYEVRINGLAETDGMCDVRAENQTDLLDLASVSAAAAELLAAARAGSAPRE